MIIKVWYDPWIPNSQLLIKRVALEMDGVTCVQELINLDTHTWKEEYIKNHFDMITAAKILQIHLYKDEPNEDDKLIWTETLLGKFSAKSIYKLILDSARSSSALQDDEN